MKHLILKIAIPLTCLLTFGYISKAQSTIPVIQLTNQHPTRSVAYKIIARYDMYYYIGLEQWINGQWREIVLDIVAATPSKTAIVKTAKAGETVKASYLLTKIPSGYRKQGHKYRLKLNYGTTAASIEKSAVSAAFDVL